MFYVENCFVLLVTVNQKMTFGLRFPKHYLFVIQRAKRNENTPVNNKDMINISSKLFYEYTLVNVHVGGLCFISVWAVGGTPRWPSNLPRGAVKISCISPLGGSQNSDLFLSRYSQPSTLFSTFYPLYLTTWMLDAPVRHLGSFYVDFVK